MLEITLLLGIVAVITLIGWWVHPSRLHASLTPDQHRRVKFWFVSAESVMSSRSRAGWRQLSGFSSSNSRFHRCRRVLPPSSGAPIALLSAHHPNVLRPFRLRGHADQAVVPFAPLGSHAAPPARLQRVHSGPFRRRGPADSSAWPFRFTWAPDSASPAFSISDSLLV